MDELVTHVHELLVTLCQQQDNGRSIGVDVLLARRLERRMHSGFAVEDDLVRRIVGNMLGKLGDRPSSGSGELHLVRKDHQVGRRCSGLAINCSLALLRLAAGGAKQRNDGASGKRALDRREKRTERKLVVRVVDDTNHAAVLLIDHLHAGPAHAVWRGPS